MVSPSPGFVYSIVYGGSPYTCVCMCREGTSSAATQARYPIVVHEEVQSGPPGYVCEGDNLPALV